MHKAAALIFVPFDFQLYIICIMEAVEGLQPRPGRHCTQRAKLSLSQTTCGLKRPTQRGEKGSRICTPRATETGRVGATCPRSSKKPAVEQGTGPRSRAHRCTNKLLRGELRLSPTQPTTPGHSKHLCWGVHMPWQWQEGEAPERDYPT